MLVVSFKPNSELLDTDINPFILASATLNHYQYLDETDFLQWTKNTMIVTVASTVLALACSIFIGYALGRFRFRGGNILGAAIFLAYLVPPTLLFIPLSEVIARFQLYNRYWAWIFTYPTFLILFASWLLMGYFRTISRELEDAALVDGATRLQAMRHIIMPLAAPGIVSAGIFCFTLAWNEFLRPGLYGVGDMKTIPVGTVSDLIRADVYFWGIADGGRYSRFGAGRDCLFVLRRQLHLRLTAGATKG